VKVADFDYRLPPELIAQTPAPRRDESRMLVLNRRTGEILDRAFKDVTTILGSNDLLVLNDTRVIPARIYGSDPKGRRVELLLLRELEPGLWEALSRPSRKTKVGVRLSYGDDWADIIEWGASGVRKVRFSTPDVLSLLQRKGEVPLPPYIKQIQEDYGRYQTVYARHDGAVAAPTAGLHFTPELLGVLRAEGVGLAYVTLHAGLGTFRPVKAEIVEEHTMYQEELEITPENARIVNEAKAAGRRIVAVGTTVTRALEAQAVLDAQLATPETHHRTTDSESGWQVHPDRKLTDLFIYPGFRFRIVDALLTNFHLPRSTLLMLVSALADREMILRAYEHAIAEKYRFYSFGDAMLIL
jgi:S-adenosylmethionine:tRNA ribosyltransferase-isomerase